MVIQRIQTLYLFITIILMAVFAYFPALTFTVGGASGDYFVYGALRTGQPGTYHLDPLLLMLIGLIIVLTLVAIFQYRNLQRQMTITFVTIIIGLALLLSIGIQAFTVPDTLSEAQVAVHWCKSNALPILAIVFLMLAHHAMSRDKKKLIDSDRLR